MSSGPQGPIFIGHNPFPSMFVITSRMRMTHMASVLFSQFLSFHLYTGGGGGVRAYALFGYMSQGLSILWLKSAHPGEGGGGNIPECHAGYLYKHHALLLTCYQSAHLLSKGNTKACTCLYSQAARHSGILPPPLLA